MSLNPIRRPRRATPIRRQAEYARKAESDERWFDSPTYSKFGRPEFIDQAGREYRLAFRFANDRETPIARLHQLRGRGDGQHVYDTVDDLIEESLREEKTLLPEYDSLLRRAKVWIRVPRSKPPLEWPAPGDTLELRYVGGQLGLEAEIVTSAKAAVVWRLRPDAATGYGFLESADLTESRCAQLLSLYK